MALQGRSVGEKDDVNHSIYTDELGLDSMRILKLLPGEGNDDLQCELVTGSLSAAENTYEAISYVWGDSSERVDITCNGCPLQVTATLARGLERLRRPREPRLLWADAICINQLSESEKGHQVKRMGRIYENAKAVVVWLGLDQDKIAQDAFDLVRETTKILTEMLHMHGGASSAVPRFVQPSPICSDLSRWDNVRKLAALRWFRRVWVIQECGLGKSCTLLWGDAEMDFVEYVELTLWVGLRADLSSLPGLSQFSSRATVQAFEDVQCRYNNTPTWRTARPLCDMTHTALRRHPGLFVSVLETGKLMKATDPRDHVYAFLGSPLAFTDEGQLMIEPDYSKSMATVYFDAACALLNNAQEAAHVLVSVEHRNSHHDLMAVEASMFPSWVPRWDRSPLSFNFGSPFNWYAAGGSSDKFAHEVQDGRRLRVSGFVFDKVSWASSDIALRDFSFNSGSWQEKFRSSRIPYIDELYRQLLDATQLPAGTETEDAFTRTLSTGYSAHFMPGTFDMQAVRADSEAYLSLVRLAANGPSLGDSDDDSQIDQGYEKNDDDGGSEKSYGSLGTMFKSNPTRFLDYIEYSAGRLLGVTSSGRMAIVPRVTEPGDLCCLLIGLHVPFILRPAREGKGVYHLVGHCYIDGVMAGELFDALQRGEVEEQWIILE